MSERPLRLTWAWLFTALAGLGLAAFLSLMGALVARAVADVDLPEDEWAWAWISAAWLGVLLAALFGMLAVATSQPSARPTVFTRIGLGLLAVVLIFVVVLFFARGGVVGWLLLVSVPPALYVLWRRGRKGSE